MDRVVPPAVRNFDSIRVKVLQPAQGLFPLRFISGIEFDLEEDVVNIAFFAYGDLIIIAQLICDSRINS